MSIVSFESVKRNSNKRSNELEHWSVVDYTHGSVTKLALVKVHNLMGVLCLLAHPSYLLVTLQCIKNIKKAIFKDWFSNPTSWLMIQKGKPCVWMFCKIRLCISMELQMKWAKKKKKKANKFNLNHFLNGFNQSILSSTCQKLRNSKLLNSKRYTQCAINVGILLKMEKEKQQYIQQQKKK